MSGLLAVRGYGPGDADATIEIFVRAIRDAAPRDYTPEQVAAWAQVDSRAGWARRRESRPTWVATLDGHAAGFSDLEPDGCLDMMFVHPRSHGLGAGSLLLRTVEAAAVGRGLREITTEASLTARSFFEGRGFAVVAAQDVRKRG